MEPDRRRPATKAQPAATTSGAIYKGLAIAPTPDGAFLYAADFHDGKIDVFDEQFQPVSKAGAFTDPTLPAGYAPFNVQDLDGRLYVTYAKQDADARGRGRRRRASASSTCTTRAARCCGGWSRGGAAERAVGPGASRRAASARFGGDLLVGNFGDGRINAYDPRSGAASTGTLRDATATRSRSTACGRCGSATASRHAPTLVFTAGIGDEAHGLLGEIVPAGGRDEH